MKTAIRDSLITLLLWGPLLAFVVFICVWLLSGAAHFESITYGSETIVENGPHKPLEPAELSDPTLAP